MTLIEDIIQVSRGSSSLPAILKEKIRQINRPAHIQVFVTPTCPYCPIAARTAHQMAIENVNIISDVVEIFEFPHLAQRYQVMAVPKIMINDKISFEGVLPDSVFVEHVLAVVKG